MKLVRVLRLLAVLVGIVCGVVPMVACERDAQGPGDGVVGTVSQPLLGDGLVISQLFVLRNTVSAYNQLYVEIFNRSDAAISLNGLSLQTATFSSAFGTNSLMRHTFPDVTVPAGGYYLVGLGSASGPGASVPSDLNRTTGTLSSTTAKVAIVRGTMAAGCGTITNRCTPDIVVDLVGYRPEGASEQLSDYESAPAWAPEPATTMALFRKGGGCVDTNDNQADFETRPAAPRSSSSPLHVCSQQQDAGADADADASDTSPDAGDGGVLPPDAGAGVVISQVYGGTTASGAAFDRNFIELFNASVAPVSLAGLSVQVQALSGNFDKTDSLRVIPLPDVVVPPGTYYLIGCNKGNSGSALPQPDLEAPSTVPVSFWGGKVAIARGTTPLPCGASDNRCGPAQVVDLVGYGSNVSDYEGTAGVEAAFSNGIHRRSEGCVDTNSNDVDLIISAPTPRNSASPIKFCDSTYGSGLVISQVYRGGGVEDQSIYERDFIELFNRSDAPKRLLGLSLQFAFGGDFHSMHPLFALPDVVVPPGGYYLIGFPRGAESTSFVADLDGPQITIFGGDLAGELAAVAKAIALARGTTNLGCGGLTCASPDIVDLVSLGNSVLLPGEPDRTTVEGPPAPPDSLTTAAVRKAEGCTDTDNNAADFEAAVPIPRASYYPLSPCDPDAGAGDAGAGDAGAGDGGAPDPQAGTGLVISQVFGGGGDGGFNRDYVEIFNRTTQPISLAGLSLQSASAQGDFGSDPKREILAFPDIRVEPERYLLVGVGSDDLTTGARVPADIVATMNLDPAGGTLALARTLSPLGCGGATRCPSTFIVDMVGYGNGTDFEGASAAPALDPTGAILRKGEGCIDTNQNGADFVSARHPVPRNRKTLAVDCALPSFGTDAGALDSGVQPTPDASAIDAGGLDAGSSDDAGAAGDESDDPGCSCGVVGVQGPRRQAIEGAAGIALVAAAMAMRRRRRGAARRCAHRSRVSDDAVPEVLLRSRRPGVRPSTARSSASTGLDDYSQPTERIA